MEIDYDKEVNPYKIAGIPITMTLLIKVGTAAGSGAAAGL